MTLDRDPLHLKAQVGQGLEFQRIGEHLKAIGVFDAVIAHRPDWQGAYAAYYGRALSRNAIRQHREAIEDCDEAIRRKSDLLDAIYLRGTAQKDLGLIEEAIIGMNAVLKADPSYFEAYHVRGGGYYIQHRWRQAIDDFTIAIENGANDSVRQCLYFRGMAFQEIGDHHGAIGDFSRVIDMDCNGAGAYLRRSYSYAELGETILAEKDFQIGQRMMRNQ